MLIMVAFEMINYFAASSWFEDYADFNVSVMLLVTILVSVRWNWLAVLFPVVDGAVCCALSSAEPLTYLIYCVGNLFIVLASLLFLAVPKKKILGKWYFTLLYVLLSYLLMALGRATVSAFCGNNFGDSFIAVIAGEFINLVFAVVGMLIFRRLDGMAEDQKEYILRIKAEAADMKRRDEYGDEPIEIDAESLAILKKDPEDFEKESLNKKDNGLFK